MSEKRHCCYIFFMCIFLPSVFPLHTLLVPIVIAYTVSASKQNVLCWPPTTTTKTKCPSFPAVAFVLSLSLLFLYCCRTSAWSILAIFRSGIAIWPVSMGKVEKLARVLLQLGLVQCHYIFILAVKSDRITKLAVLHPDFCVEMIFWCIKFISSPSKLTFWINRCMYVKYCWWWSKRCSAVLFVFAWGFHMHIKRNWKPFALSADIAECFQWE